MTKFAAFASAVSAAALLFAAPAAADYTIDEDPAFPSVVYINFDAATMPRVIMAPAGDRMSVIHGGAMEIQSDTAVQPDQTDPDSPDLNKTDTAAKDDADRTDEQDDEQTASTTPLERSVDQRVNDILGDQQKMEDIMIDADIENRLQEEADRLLN
ncbi:MAG: hypothetical protein CL534_15885 [Ahrensia sp.]|nr:hypothetical protein [Ahrensia sp.]